MRKVMLAVSLVLSSAALPAFGQNCAGFGDVFVTDGFCTAVAWMKTRGITLGCPGGNYCPKDTVTRAQMALFMYRLGHRNDVLWVAPTGGDYTSIPAAIDAAAASLPASPTNSCTPRSRTGSIRRSPASRTPAGEARTSVASSTRSRRRGRRPSTS